jgi:hypothetical protein
MSKSRKPAAAKAAPSPIASADQAAQNAAIEAAAAEQEAAEAAAAEQEAAEAAAAEQAAAADASAAAQADKSAPDQPVEEACAELGLSIEKDGHCPVEILESISGGINLNRGDPHRFEAAEAVRAVRAGIAKPRG